MPPGRPDLEIVGFHRMSEVETLLFLYSRLKAGQAVSKNRSAACLQEFGFITTESE